MGWSPEAKARAAERMRAMNADPEFKAKMRAGRRGVEVPLWVERAGLVDDYVMVAKERDEFAAARHCRRLVAEMAKS